MLQFPTWCANSSNAGAKRGLLRVCFAVSLFSSKVRAFHHVGELS